MTEAVSIPQSETGILRLYRIDPAAPQARLLAEAPTSATIAAALGLPSIPPNSAEVIRLADVAALGLRGYLTQGYDVLPEAFGPGTESLDALEGHVLIVKSSIATMGAVTLRPGPGLSPLGAFQQGTAPPTPLHVPAPERPFAPGQSPITPEPTSKMGKGGAVVLILLALVVLAFIAMFGLRL